MIVGDKLARSRIDVRARLRRCIVNIPAGVVPSRNLNISPARCILKNAPMDRSFPTALFQSAHQFLSVRGSNGRGSRAAADDYAPRIGSGTKMCGKNDAKHPGFAGKRPSAEESVSRTGAVDWIEAVGDIL